MIFSIKKQKPVKERQLTLNKKGKSSSSKPFDKFEILAEVMRRIQVWDSEMESTLS